MRFCELATELKKHLPDAPGMPNGDYVSYLVQQMLRLPMYENEAEDERDAEYNPLHGLENATLADILSGKRPISKNRAKDICSKFDGVEFESVVDDLLDSNKEQISAYFSECDCEVRPEDVGHAVTESFRQIFLGLSQGLKEVDLRLDLYEPKPSVRAIASDKIFFEEGKLIIEGACIDLPVKLDEDEVYAFENRYISALCDAYAEALSRDSVTPDDIDQLPAKYRMNYQNQRRAFLSAESVQRSIREVYEDGENQFDVLKEDAFNGISTTYYDEHENGYKRLLSVLSKVSDIRLEKSKLMLIKNLIGNLERLGIVHILVEDGALPSWVDPYGE